MKWLITQSTVPAALGAGPLMSNDALTKGFTLIGPDGMTASGEASDDVVAGDILPWARVAHGFESVKFGDMPKQLAAPTDEPMAVDDKTTTAKTKATA